MTMYNEVVVPLDGSDEAAIALRPAATVATALNAAVRLVGFHAASESEAELRAKMRQQAEVLGPTKRTIETGEAHWSVADHIEAVLKASPRSLCVMGTHGRGRSAGLVGSVALELLSEIERPLLLVGPAFEPTRFRMHGPAVVAIDGTERDDTTLDAVADFVTAFEYVPYIAHVLAKPVPRSTIDTDLPPETADAARTARRLDALVGTNGNSAEFEVLHDAHPAAAILAYANDIRAALIVMTSRGEAGFGRLKHGSVTADVIRGACCPVLATAP